MKTLNIYHTQDKRVISQEWLTKNNLLLWETCVRQIIIGTSNTPISVSGCQHYQSIKAYRFLLETICGLHSPMIGETEILAQFKQFVFEQAYNYQSNILDNQFWNSIIKDAKLIRSKYLKSYGNQSYGGVVNSMATSFENISLIGSGQLVASILPHLKHFEGAVNIYCRNKLAGKRLQDKYHNIEGIRPLEEKQQNKKTLLVIAAPVDTLWLKQYVATNIETIGKIIDLRSTQDHEQFNNPFDIEYLDLDEIFNKVKNSQFKIRKNAKLALHEVARRSLLWPTRFQHRPFGWEDICA